MADNELLSTADVAQQLGLKEGTIRAWLSRYPAIFRDGEHHITLDNKRFWTPAGVELLRSRVTENAVVPVTLQDTPADSVPSPDSAGSLNIDATLQPIADELAWQVIEQRLPYLINQSVHRMLANPDEADTQRLTEMLDRLTHGLAVIKAGTMLVGGLQAAIAASKESLKSLPGGDFNGR